MKPSFFNRKLKRPSEKHRMIANKNNVFLHLRYYHLITSYRFFHIISYILTFSITRMSERGISKEKNNNNNL